MSLAFVALPLALAGEMGVVRGRPEDRTAHAERARTDVLYVTSFPPQQT